MAIDTERVSHIQGLVNGCEIGGKVEGVHGNVVIVSRFGEDQGRDRKVVPLTDVQDFRYQGGNPRNT